MDNKPPTSLAVVLEAVVVSLAIGALVYRAAVYPLIGRPDGAAWGTADVIDFALALSLFILAGLCALYGVVLHARAEADDTGRAWRTVLVGMTSFALYSLAHPFVPALF